MYNFYGYEKNWYYSVMSKRCSHCLGLWLWSVLKMTIEKYNCQQLQFAFLNLNKTYSRWKNRFLYPITDHIVFSKQANCNLAVTFLQSQLFDIIARVCVECKLHLNFTRNWTLGLVQTQDAWIYSSACFSHVFKPINH